MLDIDQELDAVLNEFVDNYQGLDEIVTWIIRNSKFEGFSSVGDFLALKIGNEIDKIYCYKRIQPYKMTPYGLGVDIEKDNKLTQMIEEISNLRYVTLDNPEALEQIEFISKKYRGYFLDKDTFNEIISLMTNKKQLSKSLENTASDQVEYNSTEKNTLLQIISILAVELAKTKPNLQNGLKINKSALARLLATSETNGLFKNPKGEETFRNSLKKLDLQLEQ